MNSSVLKLKTVACEVGGRWNDVALSLLDEVATARARSEVEVLQAAASRAWRKRWTELLAVSVLGALASTLVNEGNGLLELDGKPPVAVDVCLDTANVSVSSVFHVVECQKEGPRAS